MKSPSKFALSRIILAISMSAIGLTALAACTGSADSWSHGTRNDVLISHQDSTGNSPYRQTGR
jgi:hypothetical protein